MPARHFVKYTFLKVDPSWRRLDDERRAADKREFGTSRIQRWFDRTWV